MGINIAATTALYYNQQPPWLLLYYYYHHSTKYQLQTDLRASPFNSFRSTDHTAATGYLMF